jgi:hypothetical protein
MINPIELTRFRLSGVFKCRGTIKSKRLSGRRLLFLFGERHGIKPFIRLNLLNAVDLDKLGALSCVGVEGHPTNDVPGQDAIKGFGELKTIHPGDDEKIIEGMLRSFGHRCDYYFWKTLALLRPELKIESVDDEGLCTKAPGLGYQYSGMRRAAIADMLKKSDLFEPENPEKEKIVEAKADLQWEQEWAEHPIHLERDVKFLENLRALWEMSGTEKAAILNAGTSHQYRLARQIPEDWSYYHIEQP